MTDQWLSRFEALLWPKGFRRDIWMIVDAARDRHIFPMLLDACLDYSCLLSGPLAPALELAAPYLLQLEFEDRKSRAFIRQGWGNQWGVFLRCDESLQTLRRHLRGLLRVRDPRGGRLFFRYYDPRVLRPYLPTCNGDELRTVFGPIECFWMEDETPATILEASLALGRLHGRRLPLDGPAPPPALAPPRADSLSPRPAGALAIRDQQLAMFARQERRKFEDWMLVHLRRFFPAQARALGESDLRHLVRRGVERAARYGITARADVCKYVDVMLLFGEAFDADARIPWAGDILKRNIRPGARMRILVHTAQYHLAQR